MGGERFYEAPATGDRRSAPAALRNREPIADVLREWLPESGLVLEIASGTGEHVAHFARRFPTLDWQPSDVHPDALASIGAVVREESLPHVRTPVVLDAASSAWPVHQADAVLSINMVHISPWESALGLLAGAARLLSRGAPLIMYGPWLEEGGEPVPSNLAFDEDLRRRDPRWGLRFVGDFAAAAEQRGLRLEQRRAMPANNLMLLLRRD
jgi:hypothetical protein